MKRVIPGPKLYEMMFAPFLETVQGIDECRAVKGVCKALGIFPCVIPAKAGIQV